MLRFQTIVAAIDFSETSQDALDAALDVARGTDARVHLVHVVPDPLHHPWVVESAGVDLLEVRRGWIEDAERGLAELAAGRTLDPRHVVTAVVTGSASGEIVRYAAEQAADVIVLGSHGHGAVRRFLLGSVADRVIRQSGCPVLVVPHRTLRAKPAATGATAAAVR
jgi:nucleotide-binding universal stress UspA family protein